jgi:subtilisin-like proprotein convertase family protein
MKIKICILSLLVGISFSTHAALYQFGTLAGGSPIGTIQDNSTIGLSSSYTVSGENSSLSSLTLTLVLQGGASGDLAGYLRLGNETSSPYYNLTSLIQGQTLSANATTTYTIDFNTAGFQSAFTGLDPNNTWTLFFADTAAGDQTTLNGWRLDVTAVPEPINVALTMFGMALIGTGVARRFFGRLKQVSR